MASISADAGQQREDPSEVNASGRIVLGIILLVLGGAGLFLLINVQASVLFWIIAGSLAVLGLYVFGTGIEDAPAKRRQAPAVTLRFTREELEVLASAVSALDDLAPRSGQVTIGSQMRQTIEDQLARSGDATLAITQSQREWARWALHLRLVCQLPAEQGQQPSDALAAAYARILASVPPPARTPAR
jgi:hypothetical protein